MRTPTRAGQQPGPHSPCGSQYLSIRMVNALAEAGVEPSVGSKCESYNNALADDGGALQGGAVSSARAMVDQVGREAGHAGMGVLV